MEKELVVVFGGCGFLGSHVTDELLAQGFRVRVFDRTRSSHLNPRVEFVQGDITDYAAVSSSIQGATYVYNFAGIADIEEAKNKPVETVRINILGNTYILEACRLQDVKRFLFASTVYVFSKAGSFYRASKQSCEALVEAYAAEHKLRYTTLRYGSLYGRRAGETNGIHRILKQALSERAVHYVGHREAMREYIHVTDAAKLSVRCLGKDYEDRNIIITGLERMSVPSLLKMISEMIPGGISISFEENPSELHYLMTPYSFTPNIGHKLVSTDHVDLGQGLLDCLNEIHEELHHQPPAENVYSTTNKLPL